MRRTWPSSWEAEYAGEGCHKCAQGRPDEDEWGVRWYEDAFADAYLLKRPAHPGYSVVVFRGRHVPDPAWFTDAEAAGYWTAVRNVGAAINRCYHPAQVNYQCMNNAVPHVHTHVLPRFVSDPGPRRLLPDRVFDSAPALDLHDLQRQVARLKAAVH